MLKNKNFYKTLILFLLILTFITPLAIAETPPETEPLNPQQVTNQGALLRGIVDNTADFPEGTVSFEIWNENEQEFQHLHTEQYDGPTVFDHYRSWDTIDFIDTGDEVEYRTRVSFDGNVMYSDTTKTFTIPETPPTVETHGYDEITDTTAELDGEIINVGDYTEWDDLEPDIYLREEGDTSWVNVESVGPDSCPDTCSFTGFASGLNPSTNYEYKAVAEVSGTKLAEGSVETFTTEEAGDFPPVIDFIIIDDDDITDTTVEIAAYIDSLGEYDELELTAEWRKSGETSWESDFITTVFEGQPPTVEEYVVDDLEPGTEYDFRFTYEYNGESGETFVQTVSTKDIIEPTVFTRNVIDITSSQGRLWGELESLGSYDEVTAVHRFRESGESDWDEVYDVKLGEPANFTFLKEDLEPGTEYEFQAVVYDEEYNEVLSLGNVKTFTTLEEDDPFVVETLDAFVGFDSATLRGDLLDLGDADVFELNMLETLDDATGSVYSVDWSSDGEYLAAGSLNNNVYIYDTSDWSLIETLDDATDWVNSVAWSSDGEYLATGGRDENVYIYDTSDWSLIETLEDSTDTVNNVDWSNGYLATGSFDENVYIYDTSDWSLIETLEDSTDRVWSVDWSSDGNYLAGSTDENVYIYDTSDWSLIETLDDATDVVRSVAFSGDGEYLATGGRDDNVYIYDTSDWSLVETLEDSTDWVNNVDWSNGYLATGSGDENVYIYDRTSKIDAFFHWRKTGATEWNNTSKQTLKETGIYNQTISNLNEQTEYEFRAVAQNDEETYYGDWNTFTTTSLVEDINVKTRNAVDIGFDQGRLWGELESIGEYEEVTGVLRFRESGESDWDEVYDVQLSEPANFTYLKTGLEEETGYEFQALVYDVEYEELLAEGEVNSFTTIEEELPSVVELFNAENVGIDRFDFGAEISMGSYNLAELIFEYREKGETSWEVADSKSIVEDGDYYAQVTGLEENTEYEYRVVIENDFEPVESEIKNVSTLDFETPDVETVDVVDIKFNEAKFLGEVTNTGDFDVEDLEMFFQYRKKGVSDWSESDVVTGLKEFDVLQKGLQENTEYEVRAAVESFVTGQEGLWTGNILTFTTEELEEFNIGRFYPADGAGLLMAMAETEKVWFVVDSTELDDCTAEIIVENMSDGDMLETYSETGSCKNLGRVETVKNIDEIVNYREGDYKSTYNIYYEGDLVVSETSEWRIGSIMDVLAGLFGVEYSFFRLLIAMLITIGSTVFVYGLTKSTEIGLITFISFVILMAYVGWLPTIVIFILLASIIAIFLLFIFNSA